jgi:cysteine sulfinate desulfinase/cysteine desulfurase-like protein
MNIDEKISSGSIRLSIGSFTTFDEIDNAILIFKNGIDILNKN